jgi:membrane protein YdbS with pleckstrin-like domain
MRPAGGLLMIIRPSAKPLLIFAIGESAISLAVLVSTVMFYPAYLMYAVVLVLILSLLIVPRAVRLKASRILIEDGKLCFETGILSKSRRTMELRKVQDVRIWAISRSKPRVNPAASQCMPLTIPIAPPATYLS